MKPPGDGGVVAGGGGRVAGGGDLGKHLDVGRGPGRDEQALPPQPAPSKPRRRRREGRRGGVAGRGRGRGALAEGLEDGEEGVSIMHARTVEHRSHARLRERVYPLILLLLLEGTVHHPHSCQAASGKYTMQGVIGVHGGISADMPGDTR